MGDRETERYGSRENGETERRGDSETVRQGTGDRETGRQGQRRIGLSGRQGERQMGLLPTYMLHCHGPVCVCMWMRMWVELGTV